MQVRPGQSESSTLKEVADYLKATERALYRLAAANKVPAFKGGGAWRFSTAHVESRTRQQAMAELAAVPRGKDGD